MSRQKLGGVANGCSSSGGQQGAHSAEGRGRAGPGSGAGGREILFHQSHKCTEKLTYFPKANNEWPWYVISMCPGNSDGVKEDALLLTNMFNNVIERLQYTLTRCLPIPFWAQNPRLDQQKREAWGTNENNWRKEAHQQPLGNTIPARGGRGNCHREGGLTHSLTPGWTLASHCLDPKCENYIKLDNIKTILCLA